VNDNGVVRAPDVHYRQSGRTQRTDLQRGNSIVWSRQKPASQVLEQEGLPSPRLPVQKHTSRQQRRDHRRWAHFGSRVDNSFSCVSGVSKVPCRNQ
jgi:hypothetical protein